MSKILINYANNLYRTSQLLNTRSAKEVGGFDEIISFSPKDIDSDFKKHHFEILKQRTGNGYFLWKPYFIKKVLEQLDENDLLFYCDSGVIFNKSPKPLLDLVNKYNQDLIPFELQLLEKYYSKRDAFILMDCDSPKYTETNQILCTFHIWRKSDFTSQFLNDWINYASDARILTDIPNSMGKDNYVGFVSNRWDQTVFSLLCKKNNLMVFRDPSQFGENFKHLYSNSDYGTILNITRKRDFSLIDLAYRGTKKIKNIF